MSHKVWGRDMTQNPPRNEMDLHLPTELRHVFRALLRAATYLPDSASRTYAHYRIVGRFRSVSEKIKSRNRIEKEALLARYHGREHIAATRRQAVQLERAGLGSLPDLKRVLLATYGRIGSRKRELVQDLLAAEEDKFSDSGSLENQIIARQEAMRAEEIGSKATPLQRYLAKKATDSERYEKVHQDPIAPQQDESSGVGNLDEGIVASQEPTSIAEKGSASTLLEGLVSWKAKGREEDQHDLESKEHGVSYTDASNNQMIEPRESTNTKTTSSKNKRLQRFIDEKVKESKGKEAGRRFPPGTKMYTFLRSQMSLQPNEWIIPQRKIRSLDPEIPAENIWGRPLPLKLQYSKTKKHWAKIMADLLPPVPSHEWNRLRDFAIGAVPIEDPPPRRSRPLEDHVLDGWAKTDALFRYFTTPVDILRKHRRDTDSVTISPELGAVYISKPESVARVKESSKKAFSDRYMRRLYGTIWKITPMMTKGDDQVWTVKWGAGRSAMHAGEISAPRGEDLRFFEGAEKAGARVESNPKRSGRQTKWRIERDHMVPRDGGLDPFEGAEKAGGDFPQRKPVQEKKFDSAAPVKKKAPVREVYYNRGVLAAV